MLGPCESRGNGILGKTPSDWFKKMWSSSLHRKLKSKRTGSYSATSSRKVLVKKWLQMLPALKTRSPPGPRSSAISGWISLYSTAWEMPWTLQITPKGSPGFVLSTTWHTLISHSWTHLFVKLKDIFLPVRCFYGGRGISSEFSHLYYQDVQTISWEALN